MEGARCAPHERGETINTLMDPSPDPRGALGALPDHDAASGAKATGARARSDQNPELEARLSRILSLLEDEKAEDIVPIDLRAKASYTDFMVIASGRSSRHVGAICEKLIEALKTMEGPRPRAEGVEHGDWALIDASDVVIHVFRPEVREFYALEKMWAAETPAPDSAEPEAPQPQPSETGADAAAAPESQKD